MVEFRHGMQILLQNKRSSAPKTLKINTKRSQVETPRGILLLYTIPRAIYPLTQDALTAFSCGIQATLATRKGGAEPNKPKQIVLIWAFK